MKTIKNAEIRKNEILHIAGKLFAEKGYDSTSTNDILDATGIARGTLYHHFKSKEDIMDGLITRETEKIISNAQRISLDKTVSVLERFIKTILSLKVNGEENEEKVLMEHLHKPQNALMHQKINQILMKEIPPILAEIVKDGVTEGLFKTNYPLECMELAFIYLKTISDDGIFVFTKEQLLGRLCAFIFHLEKLLGTKEGELHFLFSLFSEVGE